MTAAQYTPPTAGTARAKTTSDLVMAGGFGFESQ